MDLQALYNAGRSVSFDFGGQTGRLVYHPEKATRKELRKWADKIDAAADQPNADQVILDIVDEQLLELLKSWDLTEGETPLPVSRESIDALPVQLKSVMRNAIYSDNGEEAKKGRRTSSMTG